MAASSGGTMQDGLNKLLAQVAQMMILPDADLEFLSGLQMAVTQYIKQGQQPASQPQSAVPGGAGTVGPGVANNSGMMGGASMGVGQPNPDEMRRMLATQMGGQGG